MKMGKSLEGKPYEEWLRSLDWFSTEKMRVRGDLIAVYDLLVGGRRATGTDLFTLMTSDRIQGNGMKLNQGRFRLDIRKKFFTQGGVGHGNRLSREMVMAPRLTELKKCLDNVLRHMV
ncbi:hypothetical protein BTVI_151194 [Pitangus sulphuratus]|nr:hypothetical protein BTVI_151194 [Pitangus sulphuratus]